ncbi:MAG: type II secretion system protein [Bacilli bacterium]
MKIKEANKKDKKGFTMIEVLIVVAIIAVLAITIIPMISNYIQKGKDDYNAKLKNQLLVSGKEYYTNNKVKLPVKNYLGVYKNGNDYSYVTLPEMQSENYVSKDFVDADGRECSKSYVYVRQNDDNKDYEWHACLICFGEDGTTINYSEDDPACNISNWGDTSAPTCKSKALFNDDVRIYNDKVFNPTSVKLQEIVEKYSDTNPNGKLAYISIKNTTTGDNINVIAKEDIKENQNINIIDYIKNKIDGVYNVLLFDAGGHVSNSCANFIIDNTKPTCDFNLYQDEFTKTLTLTGTDSLSETQYLSKLISTNKDLTKADVEGKGVGSDKVSINLKGTKDQTYYGYVMDEAGNMKTCNQDVKIKMIDGEKPYCSFTNTFDNTWYSYSGTNKSKKLSVECYVAGGNNSTVDKEKISVSNGLGTITNITLKTGNTNSENKVMFDFDFKPTKDKYGNAIVTIESGFVKDKKDTTNDSVDSRPIKVDSIAPTITYDPLTTKQSGGWFKSPFKLKMSCSDNSQSGVKTFKVNGTTVANPKTITRTKAANPGTWKTSCTDKAGNSFSDSKKYYVRVYSTNKACPCKTYKRCSSCGCASGYYSYYWSGLKVASGGSSACTYCSSCNAHCYNLKSYTDRCTRRGANQEMYYGKCLRSYHCSYYKRCSKCACETHQKCWHY